MKVFELVRQGVSRGLYLTADEAFPGTEYVHLYVVREVEKDVAIAVFQSRDEGADDLIGVTLDSVVARRLVSEAPKWEERYIRVIELVK